MKFLISLMMKILTELRSFWKSPPTVWLANGKRTEAPAATLRLFWRVVLIGRGQPLKRIYALRLGRIGVLRRESAIIHALAAPESLFRLIVEKRVLGLFSCMLAMSASVSGYASTDFQSPGSGLGMPKYADSGWVASSGARCSLPSSLMSTLQPNPPANQRKDGIAYED